MYNAYWNVQWLVVISVGERICNRKYSTNTNTGSNINYPEFLVQDCVGLTEIHL